MRTAIAVDAPGDGSRPDPAPAPAPPGHAGEVPIIASAWLPLLFVAALLAACDPRPPAVAPSVADFLAVHWRRPLPANGAPPPGFPPIEASLDPAACGTCHPQQFADWSSSLHSRAMGAGLLGQLKAMGPWPSEAHQACLECHAPLAEQAEHLAASLSAGHTLPPSREGVSHRQGLTCAGCHVRRHVRYGPPRLDGSAPSPGASLPHAGWQATEAFTDALFCASCHQFADDGPALAGKPLENTYAEWQQSRHAREGRNCQSCHMPGRRHLWRGIHDVEMVKSGLSIVTTLHAAEDPLEATLTIINSGVGHAFPTYVTARVLVEIGQEDRHGNLIASTVERHLIARDVTLDLTEEKADTRLKPDETRRYAYARPRHPRATAVVIRITVAPDAFYADFYQAVLQDPAYAAGRAELQEALRQAQSSPYELFIERMILPVKPPLATRPN